MISRKQWHEISKENDPKVNAIDFDRFDFVSSILIPFYYLEGGGHVN